MKNNSKALAVMVAMVWAGVGVQHTMAVTTGLGLRDFSGSTFLTRSDIVNNTFTEQIIGPLGPVGDGANTLMFARSTNGGPIDTLLALQPTLQVFGEVFGGGGIIQINPMTGQASLLHRFRDSFPNEFGISTFQPHGGDYNPETDRLIVVEEGFVRFAVLEAVFDQNTGALVDFAPLGVSQQLSQVNSII